MVLLRFYARTSEVFSMFMKDLREKKVFDVELVLAFYINGFSDDFLFSRQELCTYENAMPGREVWKGG